jgi:hypothetical protein
MYARMKGLVSILALAAVAACGDARQDLLIPGEDALLSKGQGTLTFSHTTAYDQAFEQTATGETGAIAFTGSVTTPTPCYDVKATHRTSGSRVTLTVSARSTGSGCIQVIAYQNYEGAISRLTPGTYEFVVVHEVGTSRSTVFTGAVTVQ